MIIKITDICDSELGRFDAKQVSGTRVDNGEEWSKKFFANNKKLADELADFGVGDNVSVKMKQDGKHWNIVGFEEVSAAMLEKVQGMGNGGGGGGYAKSSGGAAPAKKAWDGRTGAAYDRSAAVYLAFDIMKTTLTDAKLKKLTPEEAMQSLFNISECLNDYIHDGKNPLVQEDDPLSPPEVD